MLAEQYLTILVKFEDNLFNTSNVSNESFNNVYGSAFSDVDNDSNSVIDFFKIFSIFSGILALISFITVKLIKKVMKISPDKNTTYGVIFNNDVTLPKEDTKTYFKDIPCNKDLSLAYWLCYYYSIVPKDKLKIGLIGAYLLKWTCNKKINITGDKNATIEIINNLITEEKLEKQLFNMIINASTDGKTITKSDIDLWSQKNYDKLDSWFSLTLTEEQEKLKSLGLVVLEDKENYNSTGERINYKVNKADNTLLQEALHLKGLYNYLNDLHPNQNLFHNYKKHYYH